MFGEDKVMNDNQADVVDSQTEFNDVELGEYGEGEYDTDNLASDELSEDVETEEGENDEEVAEPREEQTAEENAQFKKMRLKAEREAKKKYESQQLQFEQQQQELQRMRIQIEQQEAERRIVFDHLSPTKIRERADNEGITEEAAENMIRYETEKMIMVEKDKVQEKFNKLQAQKKELKKDKYFALLEGECDSISLANPGVDYEAIYYYQRGKRADELEKKLTSKVQKQTIANVHDRARRRSVGTSSAGGEEVVSPSTVLSEKGMKMASIFGNDPRDIAKYVKKHNTKKRG